MRTVGVFVRNKCLTLYTHQSLFLTIILPQDQLEQITGVEPAFPAWEAGVLPMNHICEKIILYLCKSDYITIPQKSKIGLPVLMLVEILCINWISTIPLERSQTWRAPDQSGSFHGNSYFNTLICLLEYTIPTEHIYILLSKNFCFLISIIFVPIFILLPPLVTLWISQLQKASKLPLRP